MAIERFEFGDAIEQRATSLVNSYGFSFEDATGLVKEIDSQAAKIKSNIEFYRENPNIEPADDLLVLPFLVVVGAAMKAVPRE